MATRIVTATEKDRDGDITGLCSGTGGWWGKVSRAQAIYDIELGTHEYYARGRSSPKESLIEVVNSPYGKYLRTVADGVLGNNLDELPNC